MASKYLIGILSYEAEPEEYRQSCRDTWLKDAIAASIDYVFLIGCPKTESPWRDGDIVYLPCADSYKDLPMKSWHFFKWALALPDWQYLVKCDTDSYICIPRLLDLDTANHEYIGCEPGGRNIGYASGACYILSRHATQVCAESRFRRRGAEDVTVGQCMSSNDIKLHKEPRIMPWGTADKRPKLNNDMIATHGIRPIAEQLRVFKMIYDELRG